MMNEKWDVRFVDLAKHISSWSKDPSTKVGAVITLDKKIISVGYNGFPIGIKDDEERLNDRNMKYRLIVHAEMNAVLTANHPIAGSTLYLWPICPCESCMKMIIQSGIKRIVYPKASPDLEARWGDSLKFAKNMALEAGLQLKELNDS